MTERYTRLYTLPSSLYSAGAPVEILAGALLLDNADGSLKCQLKFRSLSSETISRLSVTVTELDENANTVGTTEYEYSELSVVRAAEFGSRSAIVLSSDSATAFAVAVREVAFADGAVWTATAEWEPVPAQRKIKEALPEFYQQVAFRKLFGKSAIYEPVTYDGMWMCACSSHNGANEQFCPNCGINHSELFSHTASELNDMGLFLQAKKIAKEAKGKIPEYKKSLEVLAMISETYEPARIFAEKIENKISELNAKKKKRKKRLKAVFSILAAVLVLTVGFLIFNFTYLSPLMKYNEAMGYYNSGEYLSAYSRFEDCYNFKDSKDKMSTIANILYDEAYDMVLDGYYEEAYYTLATIRESIASLDIQSFITACEYLADGNYAEAVEAGWERIIIKEGTTKIFDGMFMNCTGLKSITLPSTLREIGSNAFKGCTGLTSINLPSGVETIGDYAFENCVALAEVVIPDGVVTIGEKSFYGCSGITSLTIAGSVSEIGDYCFCDLTSLVTLNYEAESLADLFECNGVFSDAGANGDGITVNIGSEVVRIPKYLFRPNASYDVPNIKAVIFEENSVCAEIGSYAFSDFYLSNSQIESIMIPESVTFIQYNAFYNCSSLTLYSAFSSRPTGWDSSITSNVYEIVYDSDGIAPPVLMDGTSFDTAFILTEGVSASVVIDTPGEYVYFKFVAPSTGYYEFYSNGSYDTCGDLYDFSQSMLASGDDRGSNFNFGITQQLISGSTYHLRVRMYSSSATGSFTVVVN